MRLMGIEAIYPKPNLSKPYPGHKIYPYLLRNKRIEEVNQVWGIDITYIRMKHGWLYLVAIMDWLSRYVLSCNLSITLEVDFCIKALGKALDIASPEIFNSDQGSQFTSIAFLHYLEERSIQISMDGKGRAMDNVFNERLWRSVKYEEVYLNDYTTVSEARQDIGNYINFYNQERPHQSLSYKTPAEMYFDSNNQEKRLDNGVHLMMTSGTINGGRSADMKLNHYMEFCISHYCIGFLSSRKVFLKSNMIKFQIIYLVHMLINLDIVQFCILTR